MHSSTSAQIKSHTISAPGERAGSTSGDLHGALFRDGRRAAGILKAGGAYLPIDPGYPKGTDCIHALKMPARESY